MDTRIGMAALALGWLSFGALASSERLRLVPDNPVMKVGLEAELAGRRCPGLKLDRAAFQAYIHANGMNYADFYMHQRSLNLQKSLTTDERLLRRDPDALCARLWSDYGSGATVAHLLSRA